MNLKVVLSTRCFNGQCVELNKSCFPMKARITTHSTGCADSVSLIKLNLRVPALLSFLTDVSAGRSCIRPALTVAYCSPLAHCIGAVLQRIMAVALFEVESLEPWHSSR